MNSRITTSPSERMNINYQQYLQNESTTLGNDGNRSGKQLKYSNLA